MKIAASPLLLLTLVSTTALAQSIVPQSGDDCTQVGTFAANYDSTSPPEGNMLVCDGAFWVVLAEYNSNQSIVFKNVVSGVTPTADEHLTTKLYVDNLVGGSALWIDNTDYISYENFHIIDAGSALPAALDDNGTRAFFYVDKEAFRGGEITGGNDAWQDGNIGTHSFAWGYNAEASGNTSVAMGRSTASGNDSFAMGISTASGGYSVAMGRSTASGNNSVAMGQSTASGGYSVALGGFFGGNSASGSNSIAIGSIYAVAAGDSSIALGYTVTSSGQYSFALGKNNMASGVSAFAVGSQITAGSGTAGDGAGDGAMAFGLQTAAQATDPRVTGDRSAVFFMDGGVTNSNSGMDFASSDTLAIVGGTFMISETQADGAAAGCIQFNAGTDALEYSDDCSTFTALNTLGGLWTDNTDYISYEGFHIIDAGSALPAVLQGDGTRAFFYVDKEAFRGGEITGGNDAWQEANIGTYSFAWGVNAEASGSSSIALGFGVSALGNYSFASGTGVTVNGSNSVGMGSATSVDGNYSVAIGSGSNASGSYSAAMGYSTAASGDHSFAVGRYAAASGNFSVSMGYGNTSSGYASTATGRGNIASGESSVAMGGDSTASGSLGFALGYLTQASGDKSFALGSEVTADGDSAMAFGLQTASQATYAQVTGDRSAVFFMSGTADENSGMDFASSDTLAIVGGTFMISETQADGAAAGCIQFNAGTDALEYSDDCSNFTALNTLGGLWTDNTDYISYENFHIIDAGSALPAALDDNGTRAFFYVDKKAFRGGEITGGNDAWQDSNIGAHSFAWGQDVEASGVNSFATGIQSTASGGGSIALGNSTASGYYSVALGRSTASSSNSVAMGLYNTASADYGVAMGKYSTASGLAAVAMGYSNAASGYSSAAFGRNNTASGSHSFAVGGDSTATGSYSIAMGRYSTASGIRSFALGNEVEAEGDSSVAFGLQTASQATNPKISGDRSAVFFMGGPTANQNSTMDFASSDTLAIVGGTFMISETQADGAAAGCIQFNAGTNALEYSDDCSNFTALNTLGGLWTDNTDYISYENFHIVDAGSALPAALDDNGTRAFFYVDKEAFRGGEITGGNDAWQDGNIGTHSFAWGQDVQASGNHSVSLGRDNTASGDFSVAIGQSNYSGYRSIAMGESNTASGTASVAMGSNNTASLYQSVAMGQSNSSTSYYSVALGYNNTSGGRGSVAAGGGNVASGYYGVAMGSGNTASAYYSVAMGSNNTASSNNYAMAIGKSNVATGLSSLAMGSGNIASGIEAVALGSEVTAEGDASIAFGLQTANQTTDPKISGDRSAVFFMGGPTANQNSTMNFASSDTLAIVGGTFMISETQADGAAAGCIQFNAGTDALEYSDDCSTFTALNTLGGLWTDNTDYISYEGFHIIDAGSALPAALQGDGTRAFFYVDKEAFRGGEIAGSNDAWADGNIGPHSFAWGLNAEASGQNSVALGSNSTASAQGSVAMSSGTATGSHSFAKGFTAGYSATASGYNSVAFGGSEASGSHSFALGYTSVASGSYSFAVGNGSTATQTGAVAFGSSDATGDSAFAAGAGNAASGNGSVSIGANNTASGNHSVAMGSGSTASGVASFAFGTYGTDATGNYSFASGYGSSASGSSSIAMGQYNTATAQYSIALGGSNSALASGAIALGTTSTASGSNSLAVGPSATAIGNQAMAIGSNALASGIKAIAIGSEVIAGSGTAGDGAGDGALVFGLQTASHATDPKISGDRTVAFFSDGGLANANSAVDVTQSDSFIIEGMLVGIGDLAPTVELDVAGDIEYTGTINGVSDRRLKSNIAPLSEKGDMLSKLESLTGYSFQMNSKIEKYGADDAPFDYGVMAQEIEVIFPELVRTSDDEIGTKTVNYIGLIPTLIESIKTLSGQNKVLTSEIETMKAMPPYSAPAFVAVPATSNSACSYGDRAADDTHMYYCIADNTWKRWVFDAW